MSENPGQDPAWHAFLNPVKRGREWETDVSGLLKSFMDAEDGSGLTDDQGRPNFTAAGMVIQGAAHTYCRKVDALHEEVKKAVSALDPDEEEAPGPDGRPRARKVDDNDLTEIIENPYEFTLKSNKDNEKTISEGPVELLPRSNPFFHEPVGEERGEEITDVETGAYVAHKNDLWCYRARFTGERYIYPGDVWIDEGPCEYDSVDRQSSREQRPSSSPMGHERESATGPDVPPASYMERCSATLFEPNPQNVDSPNPELNTIPELESAPMDESFGDDQGSFLHDPVPEPEYVNPMVDIGQFGYNQLDLSGLLENINFDDPEENAEEADQPAARVDEAKKEFIAASNVASTLMKFGDNTERLVFDPKTRYRNNCNGPFYEPPGWNDPPLEMTHERFVAIIDAHHRVIPRTREEIRRRRQLVRDYNAANRAAFGPNFNEYVTRMMAIDGRSIEEVMENEAPTMALEDPDLMDLIPELTSADVTETATVGVPHRWDEFDEPEPPTTASSVNTEDDAEAARVLREAALAGIRQASSQYMDTEIAQSVNEWRHTIRPHLEREESMPEFNIRDTIHSIDSQLQEDDEEHEWSELVEGRPQYERCRVFTSMLQMANEGKLQIIQPPDKDQGTNKAIGAFRVVTERTRERVAGDDVEPTGEKRLRAPSSPASSETPLPKRRVPKK